MPDHDVLNLIRNADKAIGKEDFDSLMEFYTEDAALVIQPGQIARGKPQIKKAFQAIAKHFGNALSVAQGKAEVIEGGDTALVLMETLLYIGPSDEPITRRATYVFNKTDNGRWLCSVDNSYGTDVLGAV